MVNEQTARTDHRGDTPDEMTSPLAANDETKPTLQRLQPDQLFSIFNQLSTALWIFDFDCKRVLWANRAGLEAWDAGSVEELAARDLAPDMSDAVEKRLNQYRADFMRNDATFSEIWTLYPKGKPRTMQLQMRGFTLPDGRVSLLCEGLVDHELHPETLRSTEALLHTPVMISLITEGGAPLYRNPASRASCVNLEDNFFDQFADPEERQDFRHLLNESDHVSSVARFKTGDGLRWHEITAKACLDAATGVPAYLISEIDVTELHETKEQAQHLASHDTLTGLPNRAFVNKHLPDMLQEAHQGNGCLHVLLIDLDGFKAVNDTYGHATGDMLLQTFASELRAMVTSEGSGRDFTARLGGDEFLVCLQGAAAAEAPALFGQRLLDSFAHAKQIDGKSLLIGFSVGYVSLPADAATLDEAMRNADLALYRAKASRSSKCVSYRSLQQPVQAKAVQS
ncbi:sensor domain-containing diguanylate cyclase [Roseibium sediminis]|uniref:sensor domain-containing diguanylate cyclase n=1 Tax=Roseibium sediminis TaxID=1775174 RepID=UPI001FCADEAB|nr:sensor domain-containing diguanylate cyclase [Roseibium sediminis]